MDMSRSSIFVAVLMAVAVSTAAQSDEPQMPKALRCEFESFSSGVAEPTASRITARIKQEPGIAPLTYAALDAAKGTAQLIGSVGAANVTLIATAFTWSFVEVTEAGNVNVTQVFLWDEPSADIGLYRAVHSRHSSIMGAIVVSQHYGRCRSLN